MQQELIELLEEIIQYWHPEDFEALDRAEALIEKAKNNAPAVPQGEPVAWMVTNGVQHSLYFSRMYADDAVWTAKNVCYKKSIPNDFQIHPLYATQAPAPAQEPVDMVPRAALHEVERERDWYKTRAQTMHEHQNGQVWYWQGDGEDHPETLVNSLPVVIRADQLRELIAKPAQDAGLTNDVIADAEKWRALKASNPQLGMSWLGNPFVGFYMGRPANKAWAEAINEGLDIDAAIIAALRAKGQ